MEKWYIQIWREGKYLDFWTVNHILGGMALAKLFSLLNINFWFAFLACFLLMLSWETYEAVQKVKETFLNRVLDIITGLLGFLIWAPASIFINTNSAFIYFILIPFIILEIWGYLAYKIKKNGR